MTKQLQTDLSSSGSRVESLENFRQRFCAKYNCRPAEFERRLLSMTIAPGTKPLAWVIGKLKPSFFAPELNILDDFGRISSKMEFNSEAQLLHSDYQNKPRSGFLRMQLGLRISGRRLLRISKSVWAEEF
ncbi:MAG: hypothetical protein M3Y82_04785 [Verrucomicrobiota bacterium]|nr:hypothetical protein [Verrucomicrobiota bacterium]